MKHQNHRTPRTADEFFAMPQHRQDEWNSVVHAVSKMRADRTSLQQTAREVGLDPRTVVRLAGSALRKTPNGQYVAKPNDQLLRVLVFPTSEGLREIAVRDSRQASLVGEYWAAVQKYLETGDSSPLHRFAGMHVTGEDGKEISLLTDLDELDRLGAAGVLSFESLYARSA